MEIGNEISTKIRSAIKAKLIDLGAYVDDELPDYIMVMVANRKTKQQMADDLNLFLGINTDKFTTWLHNLLTKLQTITQAAGSDCEHLPPEQVSNVENGSKDNISVPEPVETKTEETPSDTPSTTIKTRATDSIKETTTYKDTASKKTKASDTKSKQKSRKSSDGEKRSISVNSKDVVKERKGISEASMKQEDDNPDALEITVNADDFMEEEKQDTKTTTECLPTAKVVGAKPVRSHVATKTSSNVKATVTRRSSNQRMSVVGSIVQHHSDSDGEQYDPKSPGFKRVSSVVKVSGRRSSVPAKMQANKSLFQKAVSAAERSVETKHSGKTQTVRPIQQRLYSRSKRQDVVNDIKTAIEDEVEDDYEYDDAVDTRMVHKGGVEITIDPNERDDSIDLQDKEDDTTEDGFIDNRRIVHKEFEETQLSSPKFIVTLDGVNNDVESMDTAESDFPLFKVHAASKPFVAAKKRVSSSLSLLIPDSDGEDIEELENNTSPRKRPKLTLNQSTEKCKFWPSCSQGDSCLYVHPSTFCKAFPKCKYGEKCLFIHPSCKFDATCTRPDCQFTHATKRTIPTVSAGPTFILAPPKLFMPSIQSAMNAAGLNTMATTVPPQSKHAPPGPNPNMCRFFPKCTNMNCPYEHPKPCRFGNRCRQKSSCQFSHPELPSRAALKWTKKQHLSERPFSQSTTEYIPTPAT